MAAPSRGRRRPSRVVLFAAAAAIGIVALLAAVLAQSAPRRTGTNDALVELRLHIPAGKRACQSGQTIPAGTGFVLFFPNTDGRQAGPLRVTIRNRSGTRIAAVAPARPYGPAPLAVKIPTPERAIYDATVCIANRGDSLVDVFGAVAGEQSAQLPRGQEQVVAFAKIRFDYISADSRSWFDFAPTVAGRYGLVKATFFGDWTMWVALALLLFTCLGSVLYAGRELSR